MYTILVKNSYIYLSQGHNIVVRRYFPPSSATRECAFALSSANRDRWRIMEPPEDRSPHSYHPLTRSMSQPIEPLLPFSQRERSGSGSGLIDKEEFIRTHRRRGSEPLLSHSQVRHVPLVPKYDSGLMEGITEESDEQLDGQRIVSPVKVSNRELFPMGYRSETLYDAGWLDLGCGPSITIDITYLGHNSDATHEEEGSKNKNMVPSLLKVEVDAPCVLLRVFGSLARDLLALKVIIASNVLNYGRTFLLLLEYFTYTCRHIFHNNFIVFLSLRKTTQESTCSLKPLLHKVLHHLNVLLKKKFQVLQTSLLNLISVMVHIIQMNGS